MSDKPKYRMVTLPNGKRTRMTEEQINGYANPPEWMHGGTISAGFWYRMQAAQEWVKKHGEVNHEN